MNKSAFLKTKFGAQHLVAAAYEVTDGRSEAVLQKRLRSMDCFLCALNQRFAAFLQRYVRKYMFLI